METNWDQLADITKHLGEQKIRPVFFLIVNISYGADVDIDRGQAIVKTFANKMNETQYRMKFSDAPGDFIEIQWSSCEGFNRLVFWTMCRLQETYVSRLTDALIQEMANDTQTALQLKSSDFRVTATTFENRLRVFKPESG